MATFLRSLIGVLVLLLLTSGASARELKDVTLEIPNAKKSAEGKQEAFDQAIELATRSLAEEFMGPEKVAHSWDQIKAKILKNSTKYVVFIRGTPGESNALRVQMRLSPDNLETLLRGAGLLEVETVRLLPLVQVSESLGSRYLWWADFGDIKVASNAQNYFRRFHQQLQAQFKGKNVFILDPTNQSFRMSLPASYRTENLRKEDQALLGQYLKADVVLSGRVDVSRAKADGSEQKIEYALELWQTRTGRTLAEVTRVEGAASENHKVVQGVMDQAQPKIFAELGGKLNEVITSGNLNLSVVKITVEGKLSQRQHMELKRLLSSVREIRSLRERLVESTRLTYESEVSVGGEELGKVLQRSRFPQFSVNISSAQDDRLVLVVKGGSSG